MRLDYRTTIDLLTQWTRSPNIYSLPRLPHPSIATKPHFEIKVPAMEYPDRNLCMQEHHSRKCSMNQGITSNARTLQYRKQQMEEHLVEYREIDIAQFHMQASSHSPFQLTGQNNGSTRQ